MDWPSSPLMLPESVPVQSVEFTSSVGKFSFRILRLDLIHPVYGGNKLFKLLENVREFQAGDFKGMLSFGGAYSNHIAALARLGNELGITTYGIIRGEASSLTNPTLSRAFRDGMSIEFVNREEYKRCRVSDKTVELQSRYGKVLVVPEGGSNLPGVAGCRHIAGFVPVDVKDVVLAVGTGATLTGIRQALPADKRVWGVKVLEAKQEARWNTEFSKPVEWIGRFTFGGYARSNDELEAFVLEWNKQTGVEIEPVYTGKLFFSVIRLMEEGLLHSGPEALVIHTGGLQYLMD